MNCTEAAGPNGSALSERLGPVACATCGEAPYYTKAHIDAAVAAERERCAKLCDGISDEYQRREGGKYAELRSDAEEGASKCAAAIRVA